MSSPYNYVNIINDDGWGLVGIIPHGETNNKFKQINLKSNQKSNPKTIQNNPEATIINRKRPIKHLITKKDNSPPVSFSTTPTNNQSEHFINENLNQKMNPNALRGIIIQQHNSSNNEYDEGFGEISNLITVKKDANFLAGYGK